MSQTVDKCREFEIQNESESIANNTSETSGSVEVMTSCIETQAIVPISSSLPSKILRFQLQRRKQTPPKQNVIAVSQNGAHVCMINTTNFESHCHRDLIDLSNSGESMESVSEEEDELRPLPKEHNIQMPVLGEITNNSYHHNHHHHHHLAQHNYHQFHLHDEQLQRRGSMEGRIESNQMSHCPRGSTSTTGDEIDSNEIEIDTLDPSEIPSDHFSEEIVEQVEFYFSNDSILKDAFLLKHVRRNKEGFVSLKLVSSFKRVRQLTKDWRVVGHAVRKKGKKIELNEECTKVRRIDPLPVFDETMPSRTIVACDLPMEKLSIEKVSDIFSKCGEIALIRILKPGMAIPVDVRQFMNKYPEMQTKECALVEYVESSSARNAKNLQGSFQVYDMVAPKKKTGKKSVGAPVAKMVETYKPYSYDTTYERTRGGSFSGHITSTDPDLRFRLRRNHSDMHVRNDNMFHYPHHHVQQLPQQAAPQSQFTHHNHYHSQTRNIPMEGANASSAPSNMNFYASSPRRFEMINQARRYSGCSTDGYSTCSEISRRPSNCSIDGTDIRRDSGCSENCPCLNSRRGSQNVEPYRKLSHGSDSDCSQRRFSNGSFQFERTFSNASTDMGMMPRRQSNDFNFTRKPSGDAGSGMMIENENFHTYRRFSNNFDPKCKLGGYEYYNGRRVSTDSGYDRRCSFGSEYEGSPRSRTGSFLNSYKSGGGMGEFEGSPRSRTGSFLNSMHKAENVVRTPIGPDGSKGFGSRSRKFGQTVAPVN